MRDCAAPVVPCPPAVGVPPPAFGVFAAQPGFRDRIEFSARTGAAASWSPTTTRARARRRSGVRASPVRRTAVRDSGDSGKRERANWTFSTPGVSLARRGGLTWDRSAPQHPSARSLRRRASTDRVGEMPDGRALPSHAFSCTDPRATSRRVPQDDLPSRSAPDTKRSGSG